MIFLFRLVTQTTVKKEKNKPLELVLCCFDLFFKLGVIIHFISDSDLVHQRRQTEYLKKTKNIQINKEIISGKKKNPIKVLV